MIGRFPWSQAMRGAERGQAAVELAFILPFLILLLVVSLEGGVFLSEHISVVNAAREGARFMLDGGTSAELSGLVKTTTHGITTSDPERYRTWVITGQTNGSGVINTASATSWTVAQVVGPSPATAPALSAATIQSQLANCNIGADPCGVPANIRFIAVEVSYRHDPLFGSIALPNGPLTLRSYSIVRRL